MVSDTEYGITEADYNVLFDKQNGRCAICFADYRNSTRNLDVDHDPKTGRIRGLLCNNCNRGIEHLQDNSAIISNAYAYITAREV